MPELPQTWLQNNGVPILAEGNNPILLNGSANAWLVQSGRIDIFSVGLKDGVPSGRRDHLTRLEAGGMFFGSSAMPDGSSRGLLAVGTYNTSLCRLPLAALREAAADPVCRPAIIRLIETWVAKLSVGVLRGVPPKFFQHLDPGDEQVLGGALSVRPSGGVVWVRHLEGSSRFIGQESLVLTSGETALFFPVSAKSWIETADKVRLEALDSSRWLDGDPAWHGLDNYFRFVLEAAFICEEQSRQQAVARIKRRMKEETLVAEGASRRFASLLSRGEEWRGVAPDSAQDPLLAACTLAIEATGGRIAALPPSGTGTKIDKSRLEGIASASRMRVRQVVLKGEWWLHESGPLLGSIEESGCPVAILPSGRRGCKMVHPVNGSRTPVTSETVALLAPFAYTFYRSFEDKPLTLPDLIRFGVAGCRKDMMRAALMGVFGGFMGLLTPVFMGRVFDDLIPEGNRLQLMQVVMALITAAVTIASFQVVRSIALIRIEGRMNTTIQAAVLDRMLNMPVSFFRHYAAGDLAVRLNGINAIRHVLSGAAVLTIMNCIFSLFSLALLFMYQPKLAVIALGLAGVGIAFGAVATFMIVRHQRDSIMVEGELSGMVLQFITGISKLRVAGAEVFAFSAWADKFAAKMRANLSSGLIINAQNAFNSIFPVICAMLIYLSTSILIKEALVANKAPLSTGEFLAFNSAFTAFLTAMLQMTLTLLSALAIVPLYERALPILRGVPEIDVRKSDPGELRGEIELNHITFRYNQDGPPVLHDLSLRIKPGEFVAIVGPSGSGKSTLLRLLLGFDRPENGVVYYDGQNLSEMDVQAVRRQVGVVLQSSKLTSGSILRNIVGSLNLTINDAWEAARMAGFDKDIEQMPMQMHTVISEGGGTLSGGQRQRLLIAMALIKKPRIIFFDEATSALDNQTQSIVSQSLMKLNASKVVIAHRLSTIINADRIVVLQAGRIVEEGSYQELVESGGLFTTLAKRQIA